MVSTFKRKSLFLVGVIITSVFGAVAGYKHTDGESFVQTANADVVAVVAPETFDGCAGGGADCSGGY